LLETSDTEEVKTMLNNGKKGHINPGERAEKSSGREPKVQIGERLTPPIFEKIISARHDRMRLQAYQRICKCRT
jgi:hypothetical protein